MQKTNIRSLSIQFSRFLATLIAFGTLLPSALSQNGIIVTGIELQAAPNAVGVRWQAPFGETSIDRYKVYFARESILQNNGRFLDAEETIGDQTTIALLDLQNRGFMMGDTIYVTVTAIDSTGNEYRAFGEEKSVAVDVPQGNGGTHAAASAQVENAVAEGESTIRLVFTVPMTVPEGHPAMHFTITGESGNAVHVLGLIEEGNAFVLRTTPMTVRERYTVTVLDTVKAKDGSAMDPAKNSATFVARPSGENEPQVPTPAPVSSSSSVSSAPSTSSSSSSVAPVDSSTSSASSVSSSIPEPTPIPVPTPTPTIPEPDITPPEDATKLALQRILQSDGNYTVKASWQGSLDTAKDLASYNLYESPDRGYTFVGPTVLLGTVMSSTIANIPPGTFTLKVTALDKTGNESKGIMETIILPETGAATLLLSSLGAAAVSVRRIRRKARARR